MSDPDSGGSGWVRISIRAGSDAREAAGAFLFDLGCSGLVEDERELSGYLPEPCNREDLLIRLKTFTARLDHLFSSAAPASAALSSVPDEDWAEAWRSFFRPEQVSADLLVVPAWLPTPPAQTGHVILMDPGPAFGTGKHPTTRLCLREIERLSAESPDASFLDVGTGSGILAVYAAKLGFRPVTGIDIDPEALNWAARNIELNGLEREIALSAIPVEAMDRKYTVVAANLILSEILPLLAHLLARTEDRGRLVISGILRSQVAAVESGLPGDIAGPLHLSVEDEWACLTVGIRRVEDRQ